jgi:hypothetical protein
MTKNLLTFILILALLSFAGWLATMANTLAFVGAAVILIAVIYFTIKKTKL